MKDKITQKIREYFEYEEKFSKETLEFITWYIYQLENNRYHDLYLLAKILPEKYTSALVSYFDGDSMKLPTKEKYKELRLTAVCFFLKKIQNWTWEDIKIFLNISEDEQESFSSISYGNKINRVLENLNDDLCRIVDNKEYKKDTEEIKNILRSYLKDTRGDNVK